MTDIFISYKREEREVAQKLANALSQSGWDVWWDPDLVGGERYDDVIELALKECRCAIVLWSKRATKSNYVRDEASFALSQNKLLPIRLDEAELQLRFRNLHTLDFSDWDGSVEHPAFSELSADIQTRIGSPEKPRAVAVEKVSSRGKPGSRVRYLKTAAVVLAMFLALYVVSMYFLPSRVQPERVADEQATPEIPVTTADFDGGSRPVYAADFSTWETKRNNQGKISLGFGNSYVLEPVSNAWLGAGVDMLSADLGGDFVIDVKYRIMERTTNASLNVNLAGAGNDADVVNIYIDVWEGGKSVYTVNKGRRRSGGGLAVPHGITEDTVAERKRLPAALVGRDWSKGNTLTLKREGGRAHLFINGHLLDEFALSRFSIGRLGVSAAWESKFVITSIIARVPD